MRMDRITIFIVALLLGLAPLRAQKFPSKGIPQVTNYTPAAYGNAGKAWSIESAENGIVYFATDQGLLEYDGAFWKKFPGSKGFTRSIHLSSDSTFFTGADKDFGRWRRDSLGNFLYTSLNPFRESTKGLNQEFWGTHRIDEDLVFVSFDNIYVYREEQLTQVSAPTRFRGSFSAGNKVYICDEAEGLLSFDGLSLKPLINPPSVGFAPMEIVGVQENNRGLLIVTRNQGLFQFDGTALNAIDHEVSSFLQRDQVFSFAAIDDSHYAFGTILNGVYITDVSGRIIQHINKQKGLLNNTILSLHYSKRGKLWVGMDFGIAAIDLWSDLAYFLDQRGQVGTGQTAMLANGTFYLGSNQGLYSIRWEDLENDGQVIDFSLIPGSSGQVWSLEEINGTILCGHDRGLFQLRDGRLIPLHQEPGVLSILQLDGDHLITGNYNGISLFELRNQTWTFSKKIPPVQGAVSKLFIRNNFLWAQLPNFGVIRASLGEDYQILDQRIFPLKDFGHGPLELDLQQDTIRIFTEREEFTFLPDEEKFISSPSSSSGNRVKHLLTGRLLPRKINEDFGFYPVYNGFALENIGEEVQAPPPPPLRVRSAMAFNNDTTLYLADGDQVPRKIGNLRFHFVVPQYPDAEYQFRLLNYHDDWSAWKNALNQAEFLNLSAGEYQFQVRSRIGGKIGPPTVFSLRITVPWYRSTLAYLGYGVLLLIGILLNHRWQKRRIHAQQQEVLEREKHSLQERAIIQERENMTRRYQMMEDAIADVKKQLRSKTIELAKKAKESEEKGRVLRTMKKKITALEKGDNSLNRLAELKRMLAHFPETEDSSFGLQMEELHTEFLSTLSSRYPDLTNYDLRLCTYLKTGLSTREIAGLMNVLPSSVNVSRSRLRKKLGLASKVDLYKFLNGI
jgi:AraC family chitin signaling transcriptional activator